MTTIIITEKPSSRVASSVQTVSNPSTTVAVEVGKAPVYIQGPKGEKGDIGQGLQGIQGLQGVPGAVVVGTGDLTYDHFQALASAVWVIAHGLGKHPSVTVVDSSGAECEGAAVHDTANQITITFSAAFGGHAYLN